MYKITNSIHVTIHYLGLYRQLRRLFFSYPACLSTGVGLQQTGASPYLQFKNCFKSIANLPAVNLKNKTYQPYIWIFMASKTKVLTLTLLASFVLLCKSCSVSLVDQPLYFVMFLVLFLSTVRIRLLDPVVFFSFKGFVSTRLIILCWLLCCYCGILGIFWRFLGPISFKKFLSHYVTTP